MFFEVKEGISKFKSLPDRQQCVQFRKSPHPTVQYIVYCIPVPQRNSHHSTLQILSFQCGGTSTQQNKTLSLVRNEYVGHEAIS